MEEVEAPNVCAYDNRKDGEVLDETQPLVVKSADCQEFSSRKPTQPLVDTADVP